MTNLNAMTTDRLLYLSDWIKDRKHFTQRGIDMANQRLIEIDAELESRQPVGEFRTLEKETIFFDEKKYIIPIGFEYLGA